MQKLLRKILFILGGGVYLFLFPSCEVGLGEKVDVLAPVLEITYPPHSSVIRDWFLLAGTCDDDDGVAKVEVTVYRNILNEKGSYSLEKVGKTFPAKFDDSSNKSWHIELNNRDLNNPKYNGYEYSDDKYTIEVFCTDKAGRVSGTASRQVEIDNTPPVLILSKPLSFADDLSFSKFGRTLKLTGDVCDDHNPETLTLRAKLYNVETGEFFAEAQEISITVNYDSMSQDSPLVVANYYTEEEVVEEERKIASNTENGEQEKVPINSYSVLRKNYIDLYGKNDADIIENRIDKAYFVTFELVDTARVYQKIGDTGEGPGNINQEYYVRSNEFYSELMSESSGISLTVLKLKNLLNGTGEDYNEEEKTKIKESLAKYSVSTKEILAQKSSKFILNPTNNPYWNVAGYEIGADKNPSKLEYRPYSKGGSFTINFVAGSDGHNILGESINLDLKSETGVIMPLYIKGVPQFSTLNDLTSVTDVSISETISLPSDIDLETDKNYKIIVSGADQEKNVLCPVGGNEYGFNVRTSSNPPVVSMEGVKEYYSGTYANGNGIVVTGVIICEVSDLMENLKSCEISVTDNGQVVSGIDPKVEFTFTQPDINFKSYNYTLKLLNDGDKKLVPDNQGKYKYTVVFEVQDTKSTKQQFSFYIDNKPPAINVRSVSPVVALNEKQYLNGVPVLSVSLSDNVDLSESETLVYSLYEGIYDENTNFDLEEVKNTRKETRTYEKKDNVEILIDTTKVTTGDEEKDITILLEAKDSVGNITRHFITDYKVLQTTDIPILETSNFSEKYKFNPDGEKGEELISSDKNLFGIKSNNRLSGTVNDDDGIKTITINCKNKNINLQETPKIIDGKNSTMVSWTYNLPQSEGDYEVEILVQDINYKSASDVRNRISKKYEIAISNGEPTISIENQSGIYYKSGATIPIKIVASGSLGLTVNDGTNNLVQNNETKKYEQTITVPNDAINENTVTINYTAKDKYLQEASAEFSYKVDNEIPTYFTDETYKFKIENAVENAASYYKKTDLKIEGYYRDDDSGVDYVKCTLTPNVGDSVLFDVSASKVDGTNYYKFSTTISGFTDGTNSITFKAFDKAGNESAVTTKSVKIDTKTPQNITLFKVDDEVKLDRKLVNDSTSVKFYVNAKDNESGLKGIYYKGNALTPTTLNLYATETQKDSNHYFASSDSAASNGENFVTISEFEPKTVSDDGDVKTYAFDVYLYEITTGNLVSESVEVKAVDNAGNTASSPIFIMEVDKSAPVVTINSANWISPISKYNSKEYINGSNVEIHGSAKDNNEIQEVVVSYQVSSNGTNTGYGESTELAIIKGNECYSWQINNFDTTAIASDSSEKLVKITATAKDAAGNSGSASKEIWVCQDTDRPIITFTGLGSSSDWQKTNQLIGNVTDDDGEVSEFYIAAGIGLSRLESNSSQWTSLTSNLVNGNWTFDFDGILDGTVNVYFKVVDSAGKTFISGDEKSLLRPYYKYSKAGSVKTSDDGNIQIKKDTNVPRIFDAYFDSNDEDLKLLSVENIDSNSASHQLKASEIVGGTKKRYVKFYLLLSETAPKSVKFSIGSELSSQEIKGNKTDFSKEIDGKTYHYYTSNVIDAKSFSSGSKLVSFVVSDDAGNEVQSNYYFTIDNDGPTVSVTSPLSTSMVTGKVTITGSAIDTTSVEKVGYFVLENSDKDKTKEQLIESVRTSADCRYNSGTNQMWTFVMDGEKGDFGDIYNPLLPTGDLLSNYSYYLDSISGNFYNLPVYIYARDELGNESLYMDYKMKYNPDADKAITEILYPVANNGAQCDVSGSIRVSGSASDDQSVTEVYLQIDIDNDGDFDETDKNILSALRHNAAQIYTITKKTDIGDGTTAESNFWGIKVNGSGSWYLTINEHSELQIGKNVVDGFAAGNISSDGTYSVKVRAVAFDNNYKQGFWSDSLTLRINPNAPTISSPIILQYKNGTSSASTASQVYVPGMYLKDDWYFETDVYHASGINAIKVSTSTNGNNYMNSMDVSSSNEIAKLVSGTIGETSETTCKIRYKMATGTGQGSLYVKVEVTSGGETGLTSSSIINVNYDNTAPKIDNLKQNLQSFENGAKLTNSDNSLSLGSSVYDSASGFKMVAFYFRRKENDVYRIYNVMEKNAKIQAPFATRELGVDGKKYPLYGVEKTVSRDDDSSILLDSHISNIRVGGIVEIGGTYHRIDSINGLKMQISPSCPISETKAFFAYAQVVDNTNPEETSEITVNSFTFRSGDDGDGMPEKISKVNSTWTWSANVHANFIPDGPIEFVMFAFDNSGNVSAECVDASIVTNSPRLAKVWLGTDLNGNGTFSDVEFEEYNIKAQTGLAQESYDLTTAGFGNDSSRKSFKIKNKLAVVPEFTGGNGDIKVAFKNNSETEKCVKLSELGGGSLISLTDSITEGAIRFGTEGQKAYLFNEDELGANTGENETRAMSFTFWDSSEVWTIGKNTQYAFLRVKDFDVKQGDEKTPNVVINPFFYDNAEHNSLYKNSKNYGHIELECDLPNDKFKQSSGEFDKDPKVSGKIVVRGTAYDNVCLKELYVKFENVAYNASGVTFDANSGFVKVATYDNSSWDVVPKTLSNDGYEFKVLTNYSEAKDYFNADDMYFGQKGHKVAWELILDTEKLEKVAELDKVIYVKAVDLANNNTSSTDTSGNGDEKDEKTNKSSYKVDVVPYITALHTDQRANSGLKDQNLRSVSGKYSIIKGDVSNFITVNGFNLSPCNVRVVSLKDLKDATAASGLKDATATSGVEVFYTSDTTNKFYCSNNITKSGYLEVFVNNVRSLNNINNDEAKGNYILKDDNLKNYQNMYNREPDLYKTENPLLTDDRYLRVFDMHDTSIKDGAYPNMMMGYKKSDTNDNDNNDNVVFAYLDERGDQSNFDYSAAYQKKGAIAQRAIFDLNGDHCTRKDDFSDSMSDSMIEDTEILLIANTCDQMAMARDDDGRYYHYTIHNLGEGNGIFIYDRFANLYEKRAAWGATSGTTGVWAARVWDKGNAAVELEPVEYHDKKQPGRYKYPKIITKGGSKNGTAHVYFAYYDDADEALCFRQFQVGESVTTVTNADGTTANDKFEKLFTPENETVFSMTAKNQWYKTQYKDSKYWTGSSYDGVTSQTPPDNKVIDSGSNLKVEYFKSINKDRDGTEYKQNINITYTKTSSAHMFEGGRSKVNGGEPASKYFAMGVTSDEYVIIAWYDISNGKFYIKRTSDKQNGSDSSNLKTSWVDVPTTGISNYIGAYLSMAIDKKNGIHVAALDGNESDLVYIYWSDSSSNPVVHRIDQVGSVGNWTNIKLKETDPSEQPHTVQPYIAYFNATELGQREGIKLAYLKDSTAPENIPDGVDSNGYVNGKWEYMTIPAITVPQGGESKFQQVCLDFDSKGNPVVGYLGTSIEFGKALDED